MNYGASYDSDFGILEFDPNLHQYGFLYSYSLTNKWEDFATFAENLFLNKKEFWEAVERYEKIRNKFELISVFYETLDPKMSKEYFLDMNQVKLSER